MLGGLADLGVDVGREQHRVRAVDAGQPELGQRLGDHVGNLPWRHRAAREPGWSCSCGCRRSTPPRSPRRSPGPPRTPASWRPPSPDPSPSPVNRARRRRCPCATPRNALRAAPAACFREGGPSTPSPGEATSSRCPVLTAAVTGPPGSLTSTTRRPAMCRLNVRRRLQFDFRPSLFGDRSQIAIQVVHRGVPFRLPMPSDPSRDAETTGPLRGASCSSGSRIRQRRWAIEKVGRGGEEHASGKGCREVQDAVGVSRWVTDEHVGQHSFGDRGSARVADVVRAELALAYFAKWHVVPDDLELVAVVVLDDV